MHRFTIAAAALAAAALFALPTTASAATFTATSGNAASITTAINAAAAAGGSDTVVIPAGVYAIDTSTFPAFGTSADSITIVGAGVGQTILNGTAGGSGLINLELPTMVSGLSGFTLNANAPTNFTNGLALYRGEIQDFEINMTGAPGTGISALDLNAPGASISDGKITTVTSQTGMNAFNGAVSVRRVTLAGGTGGFGISAGGTVDGFFSRIRISGYSTGIIFQKGQLELEDSAINLGTVANATGIYAQDQSSASASSLNIQAKRITIAGSGANQFGIYTGTAEAIDTVNGTYTDLVVYNEQPGFNALLCTGSTGNAISITALASRGSITNTTGCPTVPATFSVALISSPFVDLTGGDLRPKAGSALIDSGVGTNTALGGFDAAGATRVTDGNGDGSALVDIGAYEYQQPAPTIPGGGVPPVTPVVVSPAAVITAKPKKAFKIGKKGFAVTAKGSPTFAVKFTDATAAKFTIAKQKGAQIVKVKPGTSKFSFAGKWNKKKLKPGSYKVTITPLSSSGGAGKPVTLTLKLAA